MSVNKKTNASNNYIRALVFYFYFKLQYKIEQYPNLQFY